MALIEIVDLPNLKIVIFQFAMLNYQRIIPIYIHHHSSEGEHQLLQQVPHW